jgi:hypothetical protein
LTWRQIKNVGCRARIISTKTIRRHLRQFGVGDGVGSEISTATASRNGYEVAAVMIDVGIDRS